MPTAGIQHPAAGRTAHCCATSNSAAVRVDNGNAVAGSNGINQPPRLLSLISPNFRENAGRAAGHLVRDFDTEKRPVKSRIVPKSHYRLALHPSRTWTIRPAYLEGSPVARHENISPQPKGVCIFGHRHHFEFNSCSHVLQISELFLSHSASRPTQQLQAGACFQVG